MPKQTILSGMQPSGQLHIGNYLGALKNWVDIQNNGQYNTAFFIADYHSITENYNPKEKREEVFDLMATYLAAGLDPEKSLLFVQSQVPVCTELAWIFNTVTPVNELERMTQFKDKASRQEKNINMGLFDYPVLQAADVLIYHGEIVPVGQDQVQHVELTRDVARWFNKKYDVQYFPEAKPLLTPTPKIMSPASPDKKMSKSMGDKHWIGMNESPEEIASKIAKAVSTPEGIEGLKMIYKAFKDDMKGEFNPESMSDTKKMIGDGIAKHFEGFRIAKAKMIADKDYVYSVMEQGRDKAKEIAQKTIEEVRKIVGVG